MKLKFNDEQKKLLKKIVPHVNMEKDLTDDEIIEIIDKTGDYLNLQCLDEEYKPNKEGWLCYDILDDIAEQTNDD